MVPVPAGGHSEDQKRLQSACWATADPNSHKEQVIAPTFCSKVSHLSLHFGVNCLSGCFNDVNSTTVTSSLVDTANQASLLTKLHC